MCCPMLEHTLLLWSSARRMHVLLSQTVHFLLLCNAVWFSLCFSHDCLYVCHIHRWTPNSPVRLEEWIIWIHITTSQIRWHVFSERGSASLKWLCTWPAQDKRHILSIQCSCINLTTTLHFYFNSNSQSLALFSRIPHKKTGSGRCYWSLLPAAVFLSLSSLRYLLSLRAVCRCISFTLSVFFFSPSVSWMAFSAGRNLVTFSQQCGFGGAACTDNCSWLG